MPLPLELCVRPDSDILDDIRDSVPSLDDRVPTDPLTLRGEREKINKLRLVGLVLMVQELAAALSCW